MSGEHSTTEQNILSDIVQDGKYRSRAKLWFGGTRQASILLLNERSHLLVILFYQCGFNSRMIVCHMDGSVFKYQITHRQCCGAGAGRRRTF